MGAVSSPITSSWSRYHAPLDDQDYLILIAGTQIESMDGNNLESAVLESYTVKTVTTFASWVNACPKSEVVYYSSVVEGDLMPLVHQAAIWSRLKGQLKVLERA